MKRLLIIFVMISSVLFVPQTAHAQGFLGGLFGGGSGGSGGSSGSKCGTTKTQIVACDGTTGVGAIGGMIKIATIVLSVMIGVVATGGLAYGALLYATARDNQVQLDQAKTVIRNVIIGLFMYGFTIAIINWLIPGGVIG